MTVGFFLIDILVTISGAVEWTTSYRGGLQGLFFAHELAFASFLLFVSILGRSFLGKKTFYLVLFVPILYFLFRSNIKTAVVILFVLPWLDTSKVRSAVFRPLYRQFFWILVIDVLMLGYVGAMPAEGVYLVLARVGTIYYFLHFIVVLPVVGLLEKTDPIPMSISEPVMTGGVEPSLARKLNEKV